MSAITSFPHHYLADLHCHSMISDGVLTPEAVVEQAHQAGVKLFSLTDHDEVSGIARARAMAETLGLSFVAGVEISVSWAKQTIHIVGLNIDENNTELLDGLAHTRSGRERRAKAIAADLEKHGMANAYEGSLKYVSNPDLISRSHFARFLIEHGYAKTIQDAFDRFLTSGKPGYVPHQWAKLSDAVSWINNAGGIAIIAHPARYPVSDLIQDALISEFIELGGKGIEVITSSHTPHDIERYIQIARQYKLWVSCGSDFHDPSETHTHFGHIFDHFHLLAHDLTPVWTQF